MLDSDLCKGAAVLKDGRELAAAFEAFCAAQAGAVREALFVPNRFVRRLLRFGPVQRMLASPERARLLLNLMRCEAHREVCVQLLENAMSHDWGAERRTMRP